MATHDPAPRYFPASDQSLLITLPHTEVLHLLRALQSTPVPAIQNLHPAYDTLLIRFDPFALSHAELEQLTDALLRGPAPPEAPVAIVEIPVCYGQAYAPDLAEVAARLDITSEHVIDLHTSTLYTVYFLGFVPGFAYLGELPPGLRIPRLATPRTRVPPGSVAIANAQTAVYPLPTPGGWHLIGRTPLRLFDPKRPSMSLLEVGQQVRFTSIGEAEFEARHPPRA